MRKINKLNPVAAAMGVALAASMTALPAAQADGNPFGMTKLDSGYMVAGTDKAKEGKCGGAGAPAKDMKEGKCGEGKCGNDAKMQDSKATEGKCGGDAKAKEGKCGGAK